MGVDANENPDLKAAIQVVLQFVLRMNDWETKMHFRSRIDRREYVSDQGAKLVEGITAQDLNKAYYQIIEEFCTHRERSFGGHPLSWSKGGKYPDISQDTVVDARFTDASRIEVTAKGGLFPDEYQKFVLFKEREGWRIDNTMNRMGKTGEWERSYI